VALYIRGRESGQVTDRANQREGVVGVGGGSERGRSEERQPFKGPQ
jgi:hypothetical protein